MTRAPAANQVSIAAMSRMPPPNCRGMSIAAKIADGVVVDTGAEKAP